MPSWFCSCWRSKSFWLMATVVSVCMDVSLLPSEVVFRSWLSMWGVFDVGERAKKKKNGRGKGTRKENDSHCSTKKNQFFETREKEKISCLFIHAMTPCEDRFWRKTRDDEKVGLDRRKPRINNLCRSTIRIISAACTRPCVGIERSKIR